MSRDSTSLPESSATSWRTALTVTSCQQTVSRRQQTLLRHVWLPRLKEIRLQALRAKPEKDQLVEEEDLAQAKVFM